jgi:hypothetical protein
LLRPFHTSLRYWHLLSLDAPTVAALWCWAFGRAVRLRLDPWLPVALALGTWLFYIADRLLDAAYSPDSLLQERHRFHQHHRVRFVTAAVPITIALAVLVARMPNSLIAAYCVLGGLSLIYLAMVHLPIRARGRSLPCFPKEFAVALLFAAATALPAWAAAVHHGISRSHPLLFLCPLFAALCWLNCTAIEEWEQHRRGHRIEWLASFIVAASGLSLFVLINHSARWLAMAAAVSAALFLALDRGRLAAGTRRIAADLVLLTPVFVIPLLLPHAARFAR